MRLTLAARIVILSLCISAFLMGTGAQAATSAITISSPADNSTVSGTVSIRVLPGPDVIWVYVFVDKTIAVWNPATPSVSANWDSTAVPNGKHTISAYGLAITGALAGWASISITVQNGGGARPSPVPPRPTALPTPTPPGATSFPISDAAAAARVAMDPNFEPRPGNYRANHSVPTAAALSYVGSISFLDNRGNSMIGKVTGDFTGTTDEILQWASFKWGFDPDVTRANAVTETHWDQYDIGDIGNGVSLGILQIKSSDFPGTCDPVALNGGDTSMVTDLLCLSYNYTAFAADYKLAYQRACMDGSITYLTSQTPTSGYPTYTDATGSARLWGCIGDWFSGSWYDSGAISYIQDVQNNLSTKAWLQPGF